MDDERRRREQALKQYALNNNRSLLSRIVDQINPFDKGKTGNFTLPNPFKPSVRPPVQPPQVKATPQQAMQVFRARQQNQPPSVIQDTIARIEADNRAKATAARAQPKSSLLNNVINFGNAVVNKGGGGLVRGVIRAGDFAEKASNDVVRAGIRAGALLSEPLPGQQRKAAEDFIRKYTPNSKQQKEETERFIRRYAEPNLAENADLRRKGIDWGDYDPKSTAGKYGEKTGEVIKVGTELYLINKGAGAGGKLGGNFAGNVVKLNTKNPAAVQTAVRTGQLFGSSIAGSVGSNLQSKGANTASNIKADLGLGFAGDIILPKAGKTVFKSVLSKNNILTRALKKETSTEGVRQLLSNSGVEILGKETEESIVKIAQSKSQREIRRELDKIAALNNKQAQSTVKALTGDTTSNNQVSHVTSTNNLKSILKDGKVQRIS